MNIEDCKPLCLGQVVTYDSICISIKNEHTEVPEVQFHRISTLSLQQY